MRTAVVLTANVAMGVEDHFVTNISALMVFVLHAGQPAASKNMLLVPLLTMIRIISAYCAVRVILIFLPTGMRDLLPIQVKRIMKGFKWTHPLRLLL